MSYIRKKCNEWYVETFSEELCKIATLICSKSGKSSRLSTRKDCIFKGIDYSKSKEINMSSLDKIIVRTISNE